MSLKSTLFELLYLRICRAYARHCVGERPADSIYRFLCSLQFVRVHGFWPDFVHPLRFSEKVWSRMLHDRNPQLTMLCDKLRVREYVARRIGTDHLIPLLWSGTQPEQIPFKELPSQFVIKASHGCHYNILVKDKSECDPRNIQLKLAEWLRTNYCEDYFLGVEWGYKHVSPAIIIESFIGENGKPPVDYKFYCFSGRVEVLTLHFDRFEDHKTSSFDRDFQPHEFTYHFGQWSGECRRPPNFEAMVELAESLAREFDFMRVDLYSVEDKIYFGELTPYPGGVSTKFLPASQDWILGEKWKAK